MDNRRKASRVAFKNPVILATEDRVIAGQILNLSVRGAYVILEDSSPFEIGRMVKYTIELSGATPAVEIKGHARVVRNDLRKGIALYFLRMRASTLLRIRKIVEQEFGDKAKIREEFYQYLSER